MDHRYSWTELLKSLCLYVLSGKVIKRAEPVGEQRSQEAINTSLSHAQRLASLQVIHWGGIKDTWKSIGEHFVKCLNGFKELKSCERCQMSTNLFSKYLQVSGNHYYTGLLKGIIHWTWLSLENGPGRTVNITCHLHGLLNNWGVMLLPKWTKRASCCFHFTSFQRMLSKDWWVCLVRAFCLFSPGAWAYTFYLLQWSRCFLFLLFW